MQGVRAALRQMLGPHAGIGVTDPAQDAALWDEEAAAVARAVPKRRTEFAAGRSAARAAMAEIGFAPAAIPQGRDRAPIWPVGLSGSIAHCDTCCVSVVALQEHYAVLGVDVEPATPLAPDLVAVICTPAERAWLAGESDPGLASKMIFSAKEAVYKAQYPLTGKVIGFDAVTLDMTDDTFHVVGDPTLANLKGAILIEGGLILSLAYV
ncbi:4'-phosphopantetheinyl transferase family protein [Yoonia sp.]|uniref:4'-phosphopantetheinyl transferase family protein n=1 Tax=Yoonia sp. TaxID=2212373 RepID=UPI002DFCA0ED|nr:4'-phosphopantetheinyl transferase superfamily protein [Yoonia sp.]